MAYADARHTQRNVSTLALVAALEAGLALAIIAGLSYKYNARPDTPLRTTEFTVDPPPDKKKDPPKPAPDTTRFIKKPIEARDPVITPGPGQQTFADEDSGAGDAGVGVVAFPTPTPSPAPSFTPIKAKPRGKPANWVTTNDYPSSEVRLEHEGITRFRLAIDAAGKVEDCTVTESSGWPVLDATTCDKLTRRAKFEAAIDSTGAKTAGTYVGAVNWRLPEE